MLKNRTLILPRGSAIRPTSDKVRAAVFSSLGDRVEGANFLDLFAGAGSVGIEAYSRGARHITFVEQHAGALRRNLSLLPKSGYTLICSDIYKSSFANSIYDIIYIDPPYGVYKPEGVLNWVGRRELLAQDGTLIYEESARVQAEWEQKPFLPTKKHRYGDTLIIYFKRSA